MFAPECCQSLRSVGARSSCDQLRDASHSSSGSSLQSLQRMVLRADSSGSWIAWSPSCHALKQTALSDHPPLPITTPNDASSSARLVSYPNFVVSTSSVCPVLCCSSCYVLERVAGFAKWKSCGERCRMSEWTEHNRVHSPRTLVTAGAKVTANSPCAGSEFFGFHKQLLESRAETRVALKGRDGPCAGECMRP